MACTFSSDTRLDRAGLVVGSLGARRDPALADLCFGEICRRYHPKVAAWCLRISRDREDAADAAQEVFLRLHSRLDSFRGDSRFSTWLYQVARSVALRLENKSGAKAYVVSA